MKNDDYPDEAIILCGGKGTRLQTVVKDTPKPLALVSGKPFLEYLVKQLSGWQLRHALLSTGYLADKVEKHFGNHAHGLEISYVREEIPLGTGGALRLASTFLSEGSKPVVAMNGDSYCQVDLAEAFASHALSQVGVTLVLAEVPDVSRYGAVEIGGYGMIKSFEEKGERSGPGLINAGIYIIQPGLLRTLPADRAVSFEREVLPDWIADGINGFVARGTFIDIGTPESFELAQQVFSDGI